MTKPCRHRAGTSHQRCTVVELCTVGIHSTSSMSVPNIFWLSPWSGIRRNEIFFMEHIERLVKGVLDNKSMVQNSVWSLPSLGKKFLCVSSIRPFPPPLTTGNCWSFYCLYCFAFSSCLFNYSWSHRLSSLFKMASCSSNMYVRFVHVCSWLDSSSLSYWVIFYHLDIPEFIHQPTEGLSWLFPCLAIRNKAVLHWCGRFVCGICFQIPWVNTKQCDCRILW